MNRTLSALFSALEAVIVVAVGLAIPLAPLTVLWGAQYGFAPNWTGFWRLAADAWLLGHGTDILVTLDAATAKSSGLAGASTPFVLTIAVLGFSLLTVLLARRAGKRIAETNHRLLGEIVAIIVVAGLSLGVTVSAIGSSARPSIWQGTLLPTLVFVIGLLLARSDALPAWTRWRPDTRAIVATALRGGAAASAAVVTVAALAVVASLLVNYAQIITLYENLHSEALGGVALTIAQILFLPNLVIWAAAWLVGPGFAIGDGSAVSPLGTSLGPIPSIPVLGALPQGDFVFAFAGLVVPILAGFLAGALLSGSLAERIRSTGRLTWMLGAGLGSGVVGGAILGLLAWASAGSIGPGRLQTAGPDPIMVGLVAALELGVAAFAGMAASRR
ncbi:MAG: hypothetical protein QOH69_1404 [Actinomycetota bacterium]|jgi:hypothetical protein|nr:hypothetical protein [Actinomycetota bacterium]